jgi:DNA-binding response OmpR family regulator
LRTRLSGTLDGLGFISTLRHNTETKDLPIITLSGSALELDRDRALDAGANVFLRKPCLPADLLSRVRRVMRVARLGFSV